MELLRNDINSKIYDSNTFFFNLAKNHLSSDEVEELLDTIAASYEVAHEVFPDVRPVLRLYLKQTHTPMDTSVSGWASSDAPEIGLVLPGHRPFHQYLDQILNVVIHEVAHNTHRELYPSFYDDGDRYPFRWLSAIKEGVALHTSQSVGGEKYKSHDNMTELNNAVWDALYKPESLNEESNIDFLLGKGRFSHRGYKIGHFVVGSYFENRAESAFDLFTTSSQEFTEYIRMKI